MGKTASPAPEKIGPYHRLRCACCGCPTLAGRSLEDLGDPLWPQSCLMCDWENTGPSQMPAVDDEVSLEQARANFERFNWMYDPDALPDWLPHRPSAAELQARATLRQRYAAIDQDGGGARSKELWSAARDAEEELRSLVDARTAADVDEAEAIEASAEDDAGDETEESDATEARDDNEGIGEPADDAEFLTDAVSPAEIAAGAMMMDASESDDAAVSPAVHDAGVAATTDAPLPDSGRSLGPFDFPGPPRGSAVIAGISTSNSASIAAAVLRALGEQHVMLYGAGYVDDQGAPHVIAVLPMNARAEAVESVRSFFMQQPGVLGAYIDRREGTSAV
jgi:hypothetical protein